MKIYTRRTMVEGGQRRVTHWNVRRKVAEARCRFAMGMKHFVRRYTLCSLWAKRLVHKTSFSISAVSFYRAREDIVGDTTGQGALLFRFYQDIIRFRLHHPAVRNHQLNLAYVHNANRVIAFLRSEPTEQLLVIASLANTAFSNGYSIQAGPNLPNGNWREVFNSDANDYGGDSIGNFGAVVPSNQGNIQVRIPANGFLIFSKV